MLRVQTDRAVTRDPVEGWPLSSSESSVFSSAV